jgi:hypothetical protein
MRSGRHSGPVQKETFCSFEYLRGKNETDSQGEGAERGNFIV